MRKIFIVITVCLLILAPISISQAKEASGEPRLIGFYKDSIDDYYKEASTVFTYLAGENGWDVLEKTVQGSPDEQIRAIDDFITLGVDALVVIQSSHTVSVECLRKANDAGIPYFALTHMPKVLAGQELAGYSGYDFEQTGHLAALDAIENGVTNIVLIEGKQGQRSESQMSGGFVKAYADSGLDVGDLLNADGSYNISGSGGEGLKIVYRGSGNWLASSAQSSMTDALNNLGKDGFDGVFVHNDGMMDGVLLAFEEYGLDTDEYWLASTNGASRAASWLDDGIISFEVSHSPSLEADLLFQIIDSYFAGTLEKPYVYAVQSAMEAASSDLIPFEASAYLSNRDQYSYSLNDAAVTSIDPAIFME